MALLQLKILSVQAFLECIGKIYQVLHLLLHHLENELMPYSFTNGEMIEMKEDGEISTSIGFKFKQNDFIIIVINLASQCIPDRTYSIRQQNTSNPIISLRKTHLGS